MKKRIAAGLLSLAVLFLFACGDTGMPPVDVDPPEPPAAELLAGISEPFASTNVSGFNVYTATSLIGKLGAKTYRMWMTGPTVFSGWTNTSNLSVERLSSIAANTKLQFDTYIDLLTENGVEEIVGLGDFLPKVASTAAYGMDNRYVPLRDETEGSEYMEFLAKVERCFETVAAAFPAIKVWEVGNELNHNTFITNPARDFTQEELAEINLDLMYYASRGVKKGNPQAMAITPGYAPAGGIPVVESFFKLLYEKMKSGNYPAGAVKSTESSDYFDGLCWHPYDGANGTVAISRGFDLEVWKAQNDAVFQVAKDYGDGDLKVWFTEFGYTLSGDGLIRLNEGETDITEYEVNGVRYRLNDEIETVQAEYVELYFDAMKEMAYVHSCHFFRLFCSKKDSEWGGFGEIFFGCFLEPDPNVGRTDFYPRKKAYAVQKVFGGTGDLNG